MLFHEELESLRGVESHSAGLSSPLLVFLVTAHGNGRCRDLLLLLFCRRCAFWTFRRLVSCVVSTAALLFSRLLPACAELIDPRVVRWGARCSLLLTEALRVGRRGSLVAGYFCYYRDLRNRGCRFWVGRCSWRRWSLLHPWRVCGSDGGVQLRFLDAHAFNWLQDGSLCDGGDRGGRGLGARWVGLSAV